MIRVEDGSGTVIATYYYDPFGRRLWKEVGGVRTNFLYANEGLIEEYDAAGTEIKTYGYRAHSTWMTDPLFMKQAGEYFFYQNDHLGTPQKLTAVNGAIVWSAKYSSFGEAVVDPSSIIVNNMRFSGQYFDYETNLHCNRHRYYDTAIGRYISADPIGLYGGFNVFLYVRSNPIVRIDPLGLRQDLPNYVKEFMNNSEPYYETVSDDTGYWTEPIPPIYDDIGIYPYVEPSIDEDDIGIYNFHACPKGYHYNETTGSCNYGRPIEPTLPGQTRRTYCNFYSKCVGVAADAAAIGAAVATIASGGTATPGTAAVAITATVVDVSNGIATFFICGPAWSNATSAISEIPGPPWWTIATNAVDAAVTLAGK